MSELHVARAPGRPRDASIDTRVLAAAVEELAERGIAGFSTNSVAARANVDKRGIYSRWPERERLITEALSTLAAGLVPPNTGDLRADLLALVPAVSAVYTTPRLEILHRCLTEARDYPTIYAEFRRESVDRCSAVVENAFRSAQRRAELRPRIDPASAADAFLGMILTRATLRADGTAISDAEQQSIVDFCVAAAQE